jgi:hypothetical protein
MQKNIVIRVIGWKTMREVGMIRFVKIAIFSGVQQLFFIRKVTTGGGFSCQNTYDSFRQHLPSMFVGHADRRTDAGRQMTDKAQMPKPK